MFKEINIYLRVLMGKNKSLTSMKHLILHDQDEEGKIDRKSRNQGIAYSIIKI